MRTAGHPRSCQVAIASVEGPGHRPDRLLTGAVAVQTSQTATRAPGARHRRSRRTTPACRPCSSDVHGDRGIERESTTQAHHVGVTEADQIIESHSVVSIRRSPRRTVMSTPSTVAPVCSATRRAGPPNPEPMSMTVSPGRSPRLAISLSTAPIPPAWYWSSRPASAGVSRCRVQLYPAVRRSASARSVSVYVMVVLLPSGGAVARGRRAERIWRYRGRWHGRSSPRPPSPPAAARPEPAACPVPRSSRTR